MTKDTQPRQATKEQNEDVNKQVRRIVLDKILDEEVPKVLEKPENQLRLEMLNVYRQLSENTTVTKKSSEVVLDELKKVDDLVSQLRTLIEQMQVGLSELNDKQNAMSEQIDKHDADIKLLKKMS